MVAERFRVWLTVLAVMAACSRSDPAGDPPAGARDAIPVRLVPARGRTVDRAVDIVGTLYADKEATVAAEVEGQVKEVLVDLGDRVEAGQVLARLEDDMLLASLRQAEARLESAGADEGRARQLHREGVVSPQEYQRLKTTRDGAGAERDLLAIRLKHATIRAPISGAVTSREIDVGDYARVGSPLFTVVADQRLRLRGEVSERFVPDLAVGLELRGEVDAYPGLTVRGHLSRLNAALDPKNRSLTVEAEVENSGGRLRPGFFVRGSILTQRGVDTVSVPSNAIVTLAGISHLFVFSGGEAHERQIQVGQRFEDEVEILSGLKPGEPVIVSGLTRLHDGARVRPTTETAEAG